MRESPEICPGSIAISSHFIGRHSTQSRRRERKAMESRVRFRAVLTP
jgi:hypothetical protein